MPDEPTIPHLPRHRVPPPAAAVTDDTSCEFDSQPTQPHQFGPLPREPLLPQPAHGLSKFDLGTVPASVTPPTTWRRAALFSIFASAGVLVALVFLSTALVGDPRHTSRIDALPGVGTQFPYATGNHGDRSPQHGAGGPTRSGAVSTDRTTTGKSGPVRTDDRALPAVAGVAQGGSNSVAVTSGNPASPASGSATAPAAGASTSYPPPEVTTVSTSQMFALQHTDPQPMVNNTKTYFANAADDPQAASAMTTGSLHNEGASGIERRYGDARSIQVQQIRADPSKGTTTNRITVHKKDGTTETETRTLKFTSGDNPKIASDSG